MWVTLMGVITLGLLIWFGIKAFSGAPTPTSSADGSAGSSDSGNGGAEALTQNSSTANSTKAESNQSDQQASASVAAVAGAATGAVAAAGAAASKAANSADPITVNLSSGDTIAASGNGSSGHASGIAEAISSEDAGSVREMIKILNLRESDASRLGIEKSQFSALWQGSANGVDADTLKDVSSRLRGMMS